MKKRWISLLTLVATVAIALGGWNWYQDRSPAARLRSPSLLSKTEMTDLPSIAPQRLISDVEALSFERYSQSDRLRAREYIVAALQQAGWEPELQAFEAGSNATGINIVAKRSGTDPTIGSIVLAAHYDTVEQSPGADDNATSVATVLEVARLLKQYATPHTLELVLFDLEEAGLVGSTAYAEQLSSGHNLQAAIVMDMIGYACHTEGCQSYPPLPITPPTDRGNFLGVIGDQSHAGLLDHFAQDQVVQSASAPLPQVLTLSVPTFGQMTPDLLRSDHVPFWRKGIGAVLITDTANFRNPNYHQPSDTLDTLDRNFLIGAAQIVVNATLSLLVS